MTQETEELKVKKTDILSIPPQLIVIVHPNVREDYPEDEYQRLKASIKEVGIKEAVHVRKQNDGTYALTHGFNRMRAVWELVEEGEEILYVPAKPSKKNEEEELMDHFILNMGVPLTKYEISKLLIRLKGFGWTNRKMSEKTGYSEVEVSRLLAFQNNASTEVKESVAKGEMDITPAMKLVKETGSVSNQNEALKKGRESAAKSVAKSGETKVKVKVKAKHVLSKTLSPWDKYLEIMDIVDQEARTYSGNQPLMNVAKFFHLLTDGKSTPEEVLNKFIAK